ncbi:uncharacterized protein LOC121400650 isoform X2 [Xenopus laevis]|uniref:Uncharacterized protein LOC121400650 isoform X2 n=1 Tax=Xenopus laevis TaxID=8355 RepID=A0A8J1MFH9_XENLA|nr:uncharacterized protein LOC121400650 isoform X2 [Xenopus laevis]
MGLTFSLAYRICKSTEDPSRFENFATTCPFPGRCRVSYKVAWNTKSVQPGFDDFNNPAAEQWTEGAAATDSCSVGRVQDQVWSDEQRYITRVREEDRKTTTGATTGQTPQVSQRYTRLRNWGSVYMEGQQTRLPSAVSFLCLYITKVGDTLHRLRGLVARFIPRLCGRFFRAGSPRRPGRTRRGKRKRNIQKIESGSAISQMNSFALDELRDRFFSAHKTLC